VMVDRFCESTQSVNVVAKFLFITLSTIK
jgi:hypothetical protein